MKQWRSPPLEGLQQAAGNACPAPTFQGGLPGRGPERGTHLGGKSEQLAKLGFEVVHVAFARLEARQMPLLCRVVLLEAGGDLGQPGVPRHERRRACGGRLGCDHPESLREDRRHDRDVGELQQVHEVPGLGGSALASAMSWLSAWPRSSGRNSSTSTPGGTSCTRSTCPTTSSSTSRMCLEPTYTASACSRLSRPNVTSSSLPRIEYSSSEERRVGKECR